MILYSFITSVYLISHTSFYCLQTYILLQNYCNIPIKTNNNQMKRGDSNQKGKIEAVCCLLLLLYFPSNIIANLNSYFLPFQLGRDCSGGGDVDHSGGGGIDHSSGGDCSGSGVDYGSIGCVDYSGGGGGGDCSSGGRWRLWRRCR